MAQRQSACGTSGGVMEAQVAMIATFTSFVTNIFLFTLSYKILYRVQVRQVDWPIVDNTFPFSFGIVNR